MTAVPKIAALIDAGQADADPQADLASLVAAVDRLAGEKAEARKLLKQIEAARPGLLLTEDGAALDKLDRREKDAHRKVAHADVAIPLLKARADAVREAATKAKAAPHVQAARAARDRVAKAAAEFLAANQAAEVAFASAQADLVGVDAATFVPRVGFYAYPAPDTLAHWRRALDVLFDGPPPAPPASGVVCRVTGRRQFPPYQKGDLIRLPEAEAHAAREADAVEFANPEAVAAIQDPRRAPMPEPVDGRVLVFFLRFLNIGAPHLDAGTYVLGDVAALRDLKNAVQLVRAGYAQWWTGVSDGE